MLLNAPFSSITCLVLIFCDYRPNYFRSGKETGFLFCSYLIFARQELAVTVAVTEPVLMFHTMSCLPLSTCSSYAGLLTSENKKESNADLSLCFDKRKTVGVNNDHIWFETISYRCKAFSTVVSYSRLKGVAPNPNLLLWVVRQGPWVDCKS